jgi:hypothetical protein
MNKQILSEEFLKMQKLAGIITETQYNQKNQLNESVVGTVLLGLLATAVAGGGAVIALDNIKYGPIGDVIDKIKEKRNDRRFEKNIKPILARFKNDQTLQDLFDKYDSYPANFPAIEKEITNYIESKLQPEELKHVKELVDEFHMLNLGRGFKKERDMK